MQDYTWPSVYFSYFFFTLSLVVGVFFCVRSMKDGYWKRESEAIKFQVFEEEGEGDLTRSRRVAELSAEKTESDCAERAETVRG